MGDDGIDYNIVFPEALTSGKCCSEADSSSGLPCCPIPCLYEWNPAKLCLNLNLEMLNWKASIGMWHSFHIL